MIRLICILILSSVLLSCAAPRSAEENPFKAPGGPYIVVLGVAQDAGYPQTGCYEPHCMRAWNDHSLKRKTVSLGLVDPHSGKKWLFEATPDIKGQLYELNQIAPDSLYTFEGVFWTHGHMGHYTGLMHLGYESMNTKGLKVYTLLRMQSYLENNGPWSQLVDYGNILLISIQDSSTVQIAPDLSVMAFTVPHREEYTEAVGFHIIGPSKSLVFIPDIDKWEIWDVNLSEIHESWDFALVDGSFYADGELPGRDMSKIPHPLVSNSFEYFRSLPEAKKEGVHFIHFNHTNPLLIDGSNAQNEVLEKGFNYASEGMILRLE